MTQRSTPSGALHQQAVEDYLKTIYLLATVAEPVSTSRLAEARAVKASSVTGMIKRLAQRELVHYEKHYGVTLTETGERIALNVLRRHRLLELFLVEELGFGWDEVHDEAERLEHVIGEKFVEKMALILGDPKFDPHGEPIPTKDGKITAVDTHPLSLLEPGRQAIISRITDDTNGDLLCYLAQLGIRPGTAVRVVDKAPFDGPITLEFDHASKIIGYRVAESIHVVKL